MKRKVLLLFLPILLLGIFSFNLFKSGQKEKILLEALHRSLSSVHYEKALLDKNFSQKVYDLYIKSIDSRKLYLLKEDVDLLSKYRGRLDVEIKENKFDFYDLSVSLIEKRIKETEAIYKEILEKPFDFSKEESFESDPDKLEFSKNARDRYERWRRLLKYQTLIKLDDFLTKQENAIRDKDTSVKVLEFAELEKNARDKVREDYKEYFRRLYQLTETDRLATYLNSYTGSYDPHSEYMPPREKERFDTRMSGHFEGIGATLTEQFGYTKVANIIAGSPSWKQGELKTGDIILKVAQGEAEPVSIVDMRLDDAVQLIRGKKGTEVRLTVKKPDGTIVIIPIIRDVVIIEDTYAKSAVVKIDGSSKRYGYIYLPSFYVDFSNRNGRRCAVDVGIEIEKLKKEEVDGIILDLRSNGGGSLQDVVEMAGLFIKDGPIVQVKSREDKPYILSDRDTRIQYDGNLMVMVNSISASASEILAAAMQDYERAIVVGTPSTYGKGTVQRIIELDEIVNNLYAQLKPFGALRVTVQKFYRVNGGATQLKGVVPDIVMPDIYGAFDFGEKELDNVMPWDEIAPANYKKWSLPISNMQQVKELSLARMAKNNTFTLVSDNAKRLKAQSEITQFPLNLKQYRDIQADRNNAAKKFDKMLDGDTKLAANWLADDFASFAGDTVKISSARNWHKELKKDAYLEEAVFIMQDLK
jgi:carboxyl-terminal processing protease